MTFHPFLLTLFTALILTLPVYTSSSSSSSSSTSMKSDTIKQFKTSLQSISPPNNARSEDSSSTSMCWDSILLSGAYKTLDRDDDHRDHNGVINNNDGRERGESDDNTCTKMTQEHSINLSYMLAVCHIAESGRELTNTKTKTNANYVHGYNAEAEEEEECGVTTEKVANKVSSYRQHNSNSNSHVIIIRTHTNKNINIDKCLQKLTEVEFQIYTQFKLHVYEICSDLTAIDWRAKTSRLVSELKLSSVLLMDSVEVGLSSLQNSINGSTSQITSQTNMILNDTTSIHRSQNEVMKQQETSLKYSKLIRDTQLTMSDTINTANIQLNTFKSTLDTIQSFINNIYSVISGLQSFSWFVLMVNLCYVGTSTEFTSKARLPLFAIVTVLGAVECYFDDVRFAYCNLVGFGVGGDAEIEISDQQKREVIEGLRIWSIALMAIVSCDCVRCSLTRWYNSNSNNASNSDSELQLQNQINLVDDFHKLNNQMTRNLQLFNDTHNNITTLLSQQRVDIINELSSRFDRDNDDLVDRGKSSLVFANGNGLQYNISSDCSDNTSTRTSTNTFDRSIGREVETGRGRLGTFSSDSYDYEGGRENEERRMAKVGVFNERFDVSGAYNNTDDINNNDDDDDDKQSDRVSNGSSTSTSHKPDDNDVNTKKRKISNIDVNIESDDVDSNVENNDGSVNNITIDPSPLKQTHTNEVDAVVNRQGKKMKT